MIKPANSNNSHLTVERNGKVLNVTLDYERRPVLSAQMVAEYRALQRDFREHPEQAPTWLVLRSSKPGVFCAGGDIQHYLSCIRINDRQTLAAYAHSCVDMLTGHLEGMGRDTITMAVVDGDALGGGLEALLGFDFVLASERSCFGFPEVSHGIFPGLGAYPLLARKIGREAAGEMIREGRLYTAVEMRELGLVTHCVASDALEEKASEIIRLYSGKEAELAKTRSAMMRACPLDESAIRDVVEIWTDSTMSLSCQSLQAMTGALEDARKDASYA